jgi:hypothetical protein
MLGFRSKLSLMALSLMLAASPSQAQIIFDTNFDSVAVPSGSYLILSSVEGWNATAGDGIEVQNNAAGSPYSQTNLVELDSNNNSTMTRVIEDPGSYLLTFYYSPRPNIPASSNGIDVLVGGSSIFNVTGAGAGNTVWTPYQLYFTTTLANTSLAFSALGTSDSLGGYLDNIRLVSSVPEPATWAMMLLGFGGIGFAMRRRRTIKGRLQAA